MGCPAARGRQRSGWVEPAARGSGEGGTSGACRGRSKARQRGRQLLRPCDPSFIGLGVQGGGDDPKRCVLTQIGRSHWTPATTLHSRHSRSGLILHSARHRQAVELSSSEYRDMKRPAPNSRAVLRQLVEGRVGPAWPLRHPWSTVVGADQCACFVRTPCGPSDPDRTACLCLVVAASRRRCEKISAVRERYWWPRWRAKIDGKTLL